MNNQYTADLRWDAYSLNTAQKQSVCNFGPPIATFSWSRRLATNRDESRRIVTSRLQLRVICRDSSRLVVIRRHSSRFIAIRCETALLLQIINNFIYNALKYSNTLKIGEKKKFPPSRLWQSPCKFFLILYISVRIDAADKARMQDENKKLGDQFVALGTEDLKVLRTQRTWYVWNNKHMYQN